MLQDIRNSTKGTTAKVIIGLIVIAFAFFGIESILLGGSGSSVADVNGEEISPSELQQAVNIEQRRVINAMGDNFDPAMLEEQVISQRAMQSLIERKLLLQSANDMGLHVSDAQIGAVVANMEQFQVEGQFSEQMYRAILGESGYSPASFKQAMMEDMLVSQARTGLAASEFATPAELSLGTAVVEEQRDLRYMTIPVQQFQTAGEVEPSDVQAYYQQHQDKFYSEESVVVDYIELRTEDFARPVSEEEIEAAYAREVEQGQYADQSRISHILLIQGDDESDDAYQQRIDTVQAALGGEKSFADLAAEYSDDVGSAVAGGDLGYTGGDVFPDAMEAAIAGLAVDETSAPVETDAGVHFILVTERREGEPPSLLEMRGELEEQLALQDAGPELLRTVESLKDIAFNAESLAMPAKELELDVKQSAPITRAQSDGLFSNTSLNQAIFSNDVLAGGLNSDVIELEPGHWVVVHVHEHNQPALMPIADVQAEIEATILAERSLAAAREASEAAVVALRNGESLESLAKASGYEWQVELAATRRNNALPPALALKAFRLQAPADGVAVVDYVASNAGEIYVYQLTKVTAGSLELATQPDREGIQRLVSGEFGQLLDSEYRQGLLDSAEIEVL